MNKGLGIIVNRRLHLKSHLEETITKYKGVMMTDFTGEFTVKYAIPDYFGLGKGVSQGFGAIEKIDMID